MIGDDLEEYFLKRNIPGKYSRWDKDSDDGSRHEECDHGDGDDEDYDVGNRGDELDLDDPIERQMKSATTNKLLADSSIPDEIKYGILDERSRKHNTGVKGVLADRKAHLALERAQREAKERQRAAILTRIAEGTKISWSEQQQLQQLQEEELQAAKVVKGEEDEDEDDEDDEFMAEFRAKRLAQLKATSELPKFDTVYEVSSHDFVEQIERVDKRIWVIVHLYEPGITACVRMNRALEELAVSPSMQHVKVARMACSRNNIEIDRVAFPMLSLYRGGELVETLAGSDEFGEFFKKEDVEWLLDAHLYLDNK